MAVTTQKSAQVAAVEAGTALDSRDCGSRAEYYCFRFTQAGAGDQNSVAHLVHLPAGRHRILMQASSIRNPAIASGQCDVGHAGYTQPDGTVVAAAASAFESNRALTSAGEWSPDSVFVFDYAAKGPLLVTMTFDGSGGVPDGTVIEGFFALVRG